MCENEQFSEVPAKVVEEILSTPNLTKLSFKNNQLTTLPIQVFSNRQLSHSLYYLNLSYNKLPEIPRGVLTLINLEILDVGFNNLQYLPQNMSALASLKVLSLNANNIQSLPPQIADLPSLLILELNNNPLKLPAALKPMKDDEVWLEKARSYITKHPQEFLSPLTEQHDSHYFLSSGSNSNSNSTSNLTSTSTSNLTSNSNSNSNINSSSSANNSTSTVIANSSTNSNNSVCSVSTVTGSESRTISPPSTNSAFSSTNFPNFGNHSSSQTGERLRSVSESGANLRAARRRGFVMQRNATGTTAATNFHSRGTSQEIEREKLEHRRSVSAVPNVPSIQTPQAQHSRPSTASTPISEDKPAFNSPRESPRHSTAPASIFASASLSGSEDLRLQSLKEVPNRIAEPYFGQFDISNLPMEFPKISRQLGNPFSIGTGNGDKNGNFGIPGNSDASGASGALGASGASGASGTSGTSGTSVSSGSSGHSGHSGSVGHTAYISSLQSCVNLVTSEFQRLNSSLNLNLVLNLSSNINTQLNEIQRSLDVLMSMCDKLDRRKHREIVSVVVKVFPELENAWRESPKMKSLNSLNTQVVGALNLGNATGTNSGFIGNADYLLDEQLHVQLQAAESKANNVIGLLNRLISSLALQSTDDPDFAQMISARVRELSTVCIRCGVCTRQLHEHLSSPAAISTNGRRFYDSVNMFLRAVIAVLSAIKAALPDIPQLAEGVVGPAVASLTRVVKEIPPLLEQCSARSSSEPFSDQPSSNSNSNNNNSSNINTGNGSGGAIGANGLPNLSLNVNVPMQPSAPTPLQATLGQAAKILVSPAERAERPSQSFFDAIIKQ